MAHTLRAIRRIIREELFLVEAGNPSTPRHVWNPEPDRWVIITDDGGLVDVYRTRSGRLSFQGPGDVDIKVIEDYLWKNGHL